MYKKLLVFSLAFWLGLISSQSFSQIESIRNANPSNVTAVELGCVDITI